MGVVNYDEKKINSFAETIDKLDRERKNLTVKTTMGKLLSKKDSSQVTQDLAKTTEEMRKAVQDMWGRGKTILKVPIDTISIRDDLKDLMPALDSADFGVFKDDIKRNGVIVPIVLNALDNLIDGHRRLTACKDLGIKEIPAVRVDMTDPKLMKQFAYKINVLRRHLTLKQKKHLILNIKDNIKQGLGRPCKKEGKMSQRQVAKDLGVDEKTVRNTLQGKTGMRNIPQSDPLITAPIPKEKAGVTYEAHHEQWKGSEYEADKDRPKQWIDRIVSNSNLGPKDKYQVKVSVLVSRKET